MGRTRVPTEKDLDWGRALNDEQRAVVFADDGPILVIAGAGSGKTRTLTYRVAHLVREGIKPEQILLCTFTNKAAREMVTRVESLLERNADDLWAGTFHRIANLILRRHADRLGFGLNFSILDRDDSTKLIDSCAVDLGYQRKGYRFPKGNALGGVFGLAHSTGKRVDQIIEESFPRFAEITAEVHDVGEAYKAAKRRANAMDFDDLLLHWHQLLQEFPDLLRFYSEYFKHILVDEYQDTNPLQASIIDLLASAYTNLTVVGDDAQSIYRFRGANCRHILEFPDQYDDCQTFYLQNNYRSTPQILAASNRVIAYNDEQFPKKLVANREDGHKPSVVIAGTSYDEARFIVDKIESMHYQQDIPFRDMAVLYRIHSHSLELQIALQHAGIPFTVRSGQKFFEQAHIKDVLSFLRIIYNPQDMMAWFRLLPLFPGVGPATVKKIWGRLEDEAFDPYALEDKAWQKKISANARKALSWLLELIDLAGSPDMAENPGAVLRLFYDQEYEDYLANTYDNASKRAEDILELAVIASTYKEIGEFLHEMMLQFDPSPELESEGTPNDDAVVLSTVHQAKGLEWKSVFVLGLTEGGFPFSMALDEEDGPEEERRLFYVAATRAEDQLYLCSRQYIQTRMGPKRADPSRFLWELIEDRDDNGGYIDGSLTEFLLESEKHPIFQLQILEDRGLF
jgi:DNA helicase-2/ATP-dependent DNA helicase PcrA